MRSIPNSKKEKCHEQMNAEPNKSAFRAALFDRLFFASVIASQKNRVASIKKPCRIRTGFLSVISI